MRKATAEARETLDPERWQRLKQILADALEADSSAARRRLVAARCADDPTLRAEAESLVREAEAFLQEATDSFEDCAEQATANLWQEESPRTGWRIGAYVVVRELGRGGMGAVYLAARADGQFEKEVAIKVLKRGTDTEEVLRRFAAERHILARLDHPNIARLVDAGTTDDGLPYFVMEYVAGASVTRYVREHNLSIAERLAIFLKICAAVEVAHHNHVIHRDLKPGNILVNAEGEPKLLDFGIAKLLGPGQDCLEITAAGEERLTPNCASPEQTDGRRVTEASDVYALGALLYEMLSGQKPHKFSTAQPSRDEIVRVIREEEPLAPSVAANESETARGLRGDLDAIVQFAMRKEPESRYRTVAELAADVRRHLAHEPVFARRGTAGYRARSLFARNRRALRLAAGIVALIALGALLFAFWSRQEGQPPAAGSLPEKSIAVLPFDQFSQDADRSYFADGVQDNILTDLGKVSDLKVISRSGVASYRGKARDVRQIGRELGVANVLEGSVQISGDRVRINAQLIDTRTATQVWAEHYDRRLEDLFALQSELAQTIVAQLKATLSSGEKVAIWKKPTDDLQAYDLYLRARAAVNGAPTAPDERVSWTEGIELVTQAISRDPRFTRAYCLLTELHLLMYRFGTDHTPARLAAAKDAAETALRLEPDLEESRLAMARYFYNGLNDYRRTEAELAKIPASSAHTVDYYTLASLVERRLGRWNETIRDGQKAIELDPQNLELAVNLAQTYAGLRRLAEAERVADAAIERSGGAAPPRVWLAKSEVVMSRGDLAGARAALANSPNTETMDFQLAELTDAFYGRDYAEALAVAERANELARESISYWTTLAEIHRGAGNNDEARRAYEEAKRRAEAGLVNRPDDPTLLGELAIAEAGLGRRDEAVRLAERALEVVPLEEDALIAPRSQMRLAEVLAAVGNRDAALQKLKEIVRLPFALYYGDLKLNPAWDELRGDARFDAIMAEAMSPL